MFIKFKLVEVTNPNTGETKTKIRVVHKDGHEYTLLTDKSVEEMKSERETLLSQIVLREGEYGTYAVFSTAKTIEEF